MTGRSPILSLSEAQQWQNPAPYPHRQTISVKQNPGPAAGPLLKFPGAVNRSLNVSTDETGQWSHVTCCCSQEQSKNNNNNSGLLSIMRSSPAPFIPWGKGRSCSPVGPWHFGSHNQNHSLGSVCCAHPEHILSLIRCPPYMRNNNTSSYPPRTLASLPPAASYRWPYGVLFSFWSPDSAHQTRRCWNTASSVPKKRPSWGK
jgi:hypothetical protein